MTATDKLGNRLLDNLNLAYLGYQQTSGQSIDDLIRIADAGHDPAAENIYQDPRHKLAMTAVQFNSTGAAFIQVGDWLTGSETVTDHLQISHLFGIASHDDATVVAGSGQMFGSMIPVFIEDQPLFEGWDKEFPILDFARPVFG